MRERKGVDPEGKKGEKTLGGVGEKPQSGYIM